MDKFETPINMKIFFSKQEPQQQSLTYNHYGVIAKQELPNNWLRLIKSNGEEAILNLRNVNQIITI